MITRLGDRRSALFAGIATVSAAGLLAGCTSGPKPSTQPRSPSPSASAPTAGSQLQQLAARGATATYTAVYSFHRKNHPVTATVKVWRGARDLRVDVIVGASTATLITTPAASFSCAVNHNRRVCFTVAGAGKPVTAPFNLAPLTVFSSDLTKLANDAPSYDVTVGRPFAGAGAVPAAACFGVAPAATMPAPVAKGSYCLAASGVLVAATYPSGNTVRLLSVHSGTPVARVFTPYASPTPLPG